MSEFLTQWQEAAHTTLGLFWMAFWAFALGYLISSMIQVFVTKERMQKSMGKTGPKSVALGTFFGFISSSCSFAALSTTRALFVKGAGLIPSLAFMLASTNLVVELGIIISIFLGWQFVVGEYVGGILLILAVWLLVKLTCKKEFEEKSREHAKKAEGGDSQANSKEKSWKDKIVSKAGWHQVASRYTMEWKMVWKDVTIGFTVAGIIAVFVPTEFFQSLFIGAGQESNSFLQILAQTIVGPVAAFFTFIGSMGNIPLAAVLFGQGVSFAGVMAFIFSDLVVFPVLRIQAQYYGWKMAIYILIVFLCALVGVSLVMHYGLDLLGHLPDASGFQSMTDREFFNIDYTFFLNLLFLALTTAFIVWQYYKKEKSMSTNRSLGDWILLSLSIVAYGWLAIGVAVLPFF
ncbi:permease [Alteromonas mediterranea]|uniref:permease n=1 Tax=Alteromonas mediterranea TaxID=314275 RepID=UPI0032B21A46|tara:strand:+ start:989 stop:2200 length:1212 start_codon:yes stop_codon:yes gene_type:complete